MGNSFDVSQRRSEELFLKYGNREIYEKAGAGVPDLDFPVEPDFRSLPPWAPMSVMMERIEDFRRWFPNGIPTEEERLAAKVSEEFVL